MNAEYPWTLAWTDRIGAVRSWIRPLVVLVAGITAIHGIVFVLQTSGHHLAVPTQSLLFALWGVTTVILLAGFLVLGGAYTTLAGYLESDPRVDIDILPADERQLLEPVIEAPGITQVEVVDRSDYSDAKVSQTLKALRERGLVYRERQGRTYRLYPGTILGEHATGD